MYYKSKCSIYFCHYGNLVDLNNLHIHAVHARFKSIGVIISTCTLVRCQHIKAYTVYNVHRIHLLLDHHGAFQSHLHCGSDWPDWFRCEAHCLDEVVFEWADLCGTRCLLAVQQGDVQMRWYSWHCGESIKSLRMDGLERAYQVWTCIMSYICTMHRVLLTLSLLPLQQLMRDEP